MPVFTFLFLHHPGVDSLPPWGTVQLGKTGSRWLQAGGREHPFTVFRR